MQNPFIQEQCKCIEAGVHIEELLSMLRYYAAMVGETGGSIRKRLSVSDMPKMLREDLKKIEGCGIKIPADMAGFVKDIETSIEDDDENKLYGAVDIAESRFKTAIDDSCK